MRNALLFFFFAFVSFTANAQTVIDMTFVQNPLFEVSTNDVTASLDNGPLTLGADVVITGGSGSYTYRWYTQDGETISTDHSLEVTVAGEYLLDVTDQCDCLQTIIFHITGEVPAGIHTLQAANVINYDAASTRIDFSTDASIYQACIVAMGGRLCRVATAYDGRLNYLDLSTLPPGVYVVQAITTDGNILTHKIIKK